MASFKCCYSELVEIVLKSQFDIEKSIDALKVSYPLITPDQREGIKRYLSKIFVPHFRKRWLDCSRNKKGFYNKYKKWLANTYSVELVESSNSASGAYSTHYMEIVEPSFSAQASSSTLDQQEPSTSTQAGRPEKPFDECSDRTKRRKIKQILDSVSKELLTAASKKYQNDTDFYSAEKALAILIDASLSKHDYNVLRQSSKELGSNIFPSYDQVLEQKKLCYPTEIEVSESHATVNIQTLLDHTIKRIFLIKFEVEPTVYKFKLFCKWGCDGSAGHSQYKQMFENEKETDVNLFMTTLVPLRLTTDEDTLVWENPRPSSTQFCRPIRFLFAKETPDLVRQEVGKMHEDIEKLNVTILTYNNKTIHVKHCLVLSMIDGKVTQYLTNTPSMAVCPICKAKPSEMNNLQLLDTKIIYEESIKLGLSPLHARIKFMECILHIAYNMSFKKWKTTQETKEIKLNAKKQIQEKFKKVLGLNVDVVLQGMGTSNDGNTSRRFFKDPTITSEITKVDRNLIHRFKIILDTINSSAEIDPLKFQNYCRETAILYVDLYPWYYMPNTVHKVLFHGGEVISSYMLPIGALTEEAQEARNKDFRWYRREHSRKSSRKNTNEDVFNFLTISSDPYINTFRAKPKTNNKLELHEDSKKLLY